jgi:hypothetical protein
MRRKKWQGRLSRKQSIALPKVVNARGLLTRKPSPEPPDEEGVIGSVRRLEHLVRVGCKGRPGAERMLALLNR